MKNFFKTLCVFISIACMTSAQGSFSEEESDFFVPGGICHCLRLLSGKNLILEQVRCRLVGASTFSSMLYTSTQDVTCVTVTGPMPSHSFDMLEENFPSIRLLTRGCTGCFSTSQCQQLNQFLEALAEQKVIPSFLGETFTTKDYIARCVDGSIKPL